MSTSRNFTKVPEGEHGYSLVALNFTVTPYTTLTTSLPHDKIAKSQ